jgi:hypothetical protein
MLQNLSEEIRECLRRAEECKQLSKSALTPSATKEYLEMEQRWLALARSYEFAACARSFPRGGPVSATRLKVTRISSGAGTDFTDASWKGARGIKPCCSV